MKVIANILFILGFSLLFTYLTIYTDWIIHVDLFLWFGVGLSVIIISSIALGVDIGRWTK